MGKTSEQILSAQGIKEFFQLFFREERQKMTGMRVVAYMDE